MTIKQINNVIEYLEAIERTTRHAIERLKEIKKDKKSENKLEYVTICGKNYPYKEIQKHIIKKIKGFKYGR